MTVTVPQIDIVTQEVTSKLDYFENKINGYANDVSKALDNITGITVPNVNPPSNLAKPDEAGFEPLSGLKVPDLNIDIPKPPVIDINIQPPKEMVSPEFKSLDITIPDTPILSEDLSTPNFLDPSLIPEFDITVNVPTAPTFNIQNFDKGEAPAKINLSELLKDLDLSDLELPETPEAPILNLPDMPSLAIVEAPSKPNIVDDVEIPDAPTIVLPEMDVIENIVLPTFEYNEIPVFEGEAPKLNVAIPEIDSLIANANTVIAQDYYAPCTLR